MPEPIAVARYRRPWSVTLLALLVLMIACLNLIRLTQALQQWQWLGSFLPVSPLYIAATGLFWSLVGLALVVGLWVGSGWSRYATWLGAAAYSLYFWLDRLLLTDPGLRTRNGPFLIGLNILLVAWAFWSLNRRKAKQFFGAYHES